MELSPGPVQVQLLLSTEDACVLLPITGYLCAIRNPAFWAGEMAQRLRALATLTKVLSLIPSNHMVAHNHL